MPISCWYSFSSLLCCISPREHARTRISCQISASVTCNPSSPLLLLGISCGLILALCQATGSIIYGLSQGHPLTPTFLRYVFDITVELPPASWSLIKSIPSLFEEVLWRGVILTLFLSWYSKRKALGITTLGFGLFHLLSFLDGHDVIWVLGNVIWAAILGLFYGYVVLKSDSLLPAMLVHWLGNTFVYAFTRYIQLNASITTNALYGVLITFGLVPTTLMIVWVRFVVARWPSGFRPR